MIYKHTILVVDDHPIFLKGLIEVLQTELREFEIISFQSSIEALNSIDKKRPDIAILDLDMPVMNGLTLSSKLLEQIPKLKVIMLTMHKEPEIVKSIISKGIDGYVFKDDAVIELVEAIKNVMEGKRFISDSQIIQFKTEQEELFQSLTKTELLVLKYISEEKSSKEISNLLFVSNKTIENHRNNISRKLQLKGSNSLLKFAVANKTYFTINFF